jgi:predicted nucleotidyltransferase
VTAARAEGHLPGVVPGLEEPFRTLAEAIAPFLAGAQVAYVLGSFGTPYFRPESDIDLAVRFPEKLGWRRRVELASALGAAAGRDVDLVDLWVADPIIRMQVLKSGTLLWVADHRARRESEMATISLYHDLKLLRRPAEQAYWAVGRS